MKAAYYTKYGPPDVLSIRDIEKPTPKDGEVLVEVKAACVNTYDWHLVEAKPFFTRFLSGIFKPKNNIPGADIAGVVAGIGKGAGKFKLGDEVYGCLEGCGKSGLAAGGFAEYVCAQEGNLALKPQELPFVETAALPMAALTALQAIRDTAKLERGQSILINGASGGVGMFAVQIAKAFGAQVTAVCSTKSIPIVRELGAKHVIDYTKLSAVNGKQYDVIIDVAANISVKGYRRALKQNGRCAVIGYSTLRHTLSYNLAGKRDGKEIKLCAANNKNGDDLLELNKLIETGQLRVIIDSYYPLADTANALRRVKEGHPTGKVVIEMGEEG